MTRIDEIYDNVFYPKIASKPAQSMHYFDPFGRTDKDALCVKPYIDSRKKIFLFWDQEPFFNEDIHTNTIEYFYQNFIPHKTIDINVPFRNIGFKKTPNAKYGNYYKVPPLHLIEKVFITSEKNSINVNNICNKYDFEQQYYFFHGWAALDWYRGYNRSFIIPKYKNRLIKNTFISPNRVVSGKRQHRIELFKNMIKHDLLKNNKVSFPKICPYSNETFDIDGVDLPLVFDNEVGGKIPNESYKVSLWEQSKNSLLYIVTETIYHEQTLHLTEKIFKPIVMQMPFILVAPKYSLEYLRSYGFKTFGDFWSEDYDNQNNNKRLESITNLLIDLNNLSLKEKIQLQKHITPIVEHNFNWFYSNKFEDLLWTELSNMIKKW